jgi:hypothetical protein
VRIGETLRNMTETEGWLYTEQHILDQIDYNKGRLQDCESWEEVLQHRAKVEALSSLLVHIEQTIRGGGEEE